MFDIGLCHISVISNQYGALEVSKNTFYFLLFATDTFKFFMNMLQLVGF